MNSQFSILRMYTACKPAYSAHVNVSTLEYEKLQVLKHDQGRYSVVVDRLVLPNRKVDQCTLQGNEKENSMSRWISCHTKDVGDTLRCVREIGATETQVLKRKAMKVDHAVVLQRYVITG